MYFLSFVNDIMIFGKANKTTCMKMKRIIDEYCVILGQKVNFHKSGFQAMKKVTN